MSGAVRVTVRVGKRGARVSIRGLAIGGPFADALTVSLAVTPPLGVTGINWTGVAAGCAGGPSRLVCRD